MNKFIILGLFFSVIFAITQAQTQELPVVQNFHVEKYLGHWYLISSISKIFNFYCICSETTYAIDP